MIQLSPEWFRIREKKLSASHAQAIGNHGKGLVTYVNQIMAEYYSNAPKEPFNNEHTQRGIELEPDAAMAYGFECCGETQTVGFVEYNQYVGCSPDLLVSDNGLAEIKCFNDMKHFGMIINPKFESRYIWQAQMQLLITEREYCDLVAYNPNFDQSLVVVRILPDQKKFQQLQEGFEFGIDMIVKIEKQMEVKQ